MRQNCYYYRHYSFAKDIQMILCTVLGKKMLYVGMKLSNLGNYYLEYDNGKELSDIYYEWSRDINNQRNIWIEAIENYCGSVHKNINGFLRGMAEIYPFQNYLDAILAMLSTVPLLPSNTILYRALPYEIIKIILAETEINGAYQEKGLLSTSINLKGISRFLEDLEKNEMPVLKLYVPKGTPALYIEDIKGSGMGRGEFEMILPTDCKIKMRQSPYREEKYGYWIYGCNLEYE